MDKEIIIYKTPEGNVSVEVSYGNDTFWLTQKGIAHLFGVEVPAINKHLNNIYQSSELKKDSTISILETVQIEGKRKVKRKIEYYNLDAIIAVGYRVNSYNATQFRIWSTNVLKDYLLKGYAINNRMSRIEDSVDELKQKVVWFFQDGYTNFGITSKDEMKIVFSLYLLFAKMTKLKNEFRNNNCR